RTGRERGVLRENFGGASDPGGFAAAREQRLALLDQTVRLSGAAALARAFDQRPAPFGNRLQQFAEERGVHGIPSARTRSGVSRGMPGFADCNIMRRGGSIVIARRRYGQMPIGAPLSLDVVAVTPALRLAKELRHAWSVGRYQSARTRSHFGGPMGRADSR